MKLKINIGLGDIIVYKSQLLPLSYNKEVIVSPNYGLLHFRNYNIECLNNFIIKIFSDSNIKVEFNKDYPHITNLVLSESYNLKPNFIDLKNILVDEKYLTNLPDNYIVIHSKIRGFSEKDFDKFLLKTLKYIHSNVKCNIVLLGERNIQPTYEYNMHAIKNTFCIYNKIMKLFKHDSRIIDLTFNVISKINPDIDSIIRDCSVMSKAKTNVIFGWGGNWVLAGSVGNLSNFVQNDLIDRLILSFIKQYTVEEKKIITEDLNIFNNHISRMVL